MLKKAEVEACLPTAAHISRRPLLHIGLLNPYLDRAEDQAGRSLQAAAPEAGLKLTPLHPDELEETASFDFLISTTTAIRKTTSHPTFLSAHLPRIAYVEDPVAFANLCSYDGYFCIADTLKGFLRNLASGLGKVVIEPGAYYNAPQALDLEADVEGLVADGRLSLSYFGTNWEPRSRRLFRGLCERDDFSLYGPDGAWDGFPAGCCKGPVPFDGVSVQKTYAACGAGLVSLSSEHLLDEVISNRIFEIVSVGACAICPDIRWIRQHFGDSVWYYRPSGDGAAIGDINAALDDIRAHPFAAQARARAARRGFEGKFDAATLLGNAAAYYERWTSATKARREAVGDPCIDVIVRVGGRSVEIVARAIESIEAQSAGRFQIIFVAYRPIDLSALTGRAFSKIIGFLTVEASGANRGQAIAAGLAAVRSQYFAVLDDDDRLLRNHFSGLLIALSRLEGEDRFAYSDILKHDESAQAGRIKVHAEGPAEGDIYALMQRFTAHCFLATSSTLAKIRYQHWDLATAEDVLLIMALLGWAQPVYAAGATAIYSVGGGDASDFLNDPQRRLDELSLRLEVAPWRSRIESRFPPMACSSLDLIGPSVRRLAEERRSALVGGAVISNAIEVSLDAVSSAPGPLEGGAFHGGVFADGDMVFAAAHLGLGRLSGGQAAAESNGLRVAPQAPWAVGMRLDVSDLTIRGCTTTAVMSLDGVDASLWLDLFDASGAIVSQTKAPATRSTLAIAVTGPIGVAMSAVGLQAGVAGAEECRIRALHLGYRIEELEEAFGETDRPAILARLEQQLESLVVGLPREAGAVQSVDYRTPGNVFRQPKDGPFRAGALRTLSVGRIPWAYVAQIKIAAGAPGRALRIRLADVAETLTLFIVDEGFGAVRTEQLRVLSGKRAVEAWLTAPAEGGWLVLQAGASPDAGAFVLESIALII